MRKVLEGVLESFLPPELLQFLNLNKKSGELVVITDDKEAHIFFDSGEIVHASSNQQRFWLANVLLRKKKIDASRVEWLETLMLRQKEKFGRIAVEQGLLTEEELKAFLKIQTSEIIYDCFRWDHGAFLFYADCVPPENAVTISMDLTNLIMEGARRMDELDYFSQKLPGKDEVLHVVLDPNVQERISLSIEEWRILFLVNGKRSLQQICEASQDEMLDVYRVIYGLYASKLVEVLPQSRIATGEMQMSPERRIGVTQKLSASDIKLLISPTARLTWRDVFKFTIAQLTRFHEKREEVFPLTEAQYSIGSSPARDIVLRDPDVSPVHARITREENGYRLEDLTSLTGTFVNGAAIRSTMLEHHDRIKIGSIELVYSIIVKPQ